jgi:hypothetical protein
MPLNRSPGRSYSISGNNLAFFEIICRKLLPDGNLRQPRNTANSPGNGCFFALTTLDCGRPRLFLLNSFFTALHFFASAIGVAHD